MTKQDMIGEDNLGGVTRKMTTKDRVSIIVQAAYNNGWPKECCESDSIDVTYYERDNNVLVMGLAEEHTGPVWIQQFTLPCLIFNPDFMRAIWGEELVCLYCGYKYKSLDSCEECYAALEGWHKYITAYNYHQMQAIKLSDGDYIKYLYEQLPKKGEGDE